ncbi:MAG: dipeptide epimerase [Anaerolineae bacterium]
MRQAYWLRLEDDSGWGEGTIPPYYGIEDDEMSAYWKEAAQRQAPFPDDPAQIGTWVGEIGPAPARCALDLALHDRIGRRRDVPLYELLGLPRPLPRSTSFTIGMDSPTETARQTAKLRGYTIFKVKVGGKDDEGVIAAIRQARPDVRLRVDANAAWTVDEAVRCIHKLSRYGIELVEQPVARDDIEGMGWVQQQVDVPIVADESVQTLEDVERLAADGVQGVNIKLMKVGGLAPGLRMLKRARELGMRIMLGCMVETSLGTTAMAHLAGMADWLDLDAPLLLSNDPFDGLRYDVQGKLYLSARPGIGVIQRSKLRNDEID